MGTTGSDPKRSTDHLVRRADALLLRGGTLESSGGSEPIANSVLVDAVADTLGKLAAPEASDKSEFQANSKNMQVAKSVVSRARVALHTVNDTLTTSGGTAGTGWW